MCRYPLASITGFIFLCVSLACADATLDNLVQTGKYKEAIEYADQKIPAGSRTADVWVKIAEANEKQGLTEKALACYMVSWRMNPKDYASLLGAARIYNKLEQPNEAMDMAKKALEQNFAGEASWEYARACIALKRPADAKKALEKVIETDPSNLVANRELGHIYFEDKQYREAVPLLKKAYAASPDPDVAFKIGKSYVEANAASSAVEFLKKVLELKPTHYEAGLELARAYYGMGKHLAAASEYDKIQNRIRLTDKDYYQMAVSLEETGKKGEAVEVYRKAITAFGNSRSQEAIGARLKVGRYDLEKNNFAGALAQFSFIVEADPNARTVKDIYFLLADAYMGTKNAIRAISSLEKAIELDKSNIEAYARLADLYRQNNMHDKAKKTYEAMMALRPNDPNVYLILGEYNLNARQYSAALDNYTKSNSLKKSPDALEGMALSARALNRWDNARDAAESAVTMDKNRYPARKVLAEAYVRGKHYREAMGQLEVLVGKEPNNKKYWEDLATCYDDLKQTDKLAQADKKLIRLDKKNSESRLRFAQYSLSKGDKGTAYGLFKELASLTPKDASVFKNLYELAKEKKELSSAITYLRHYLEINPNDAESQRDMGDMLYEQKQYDGALAAYRMAIKIDPAIKGFHKRYAEIVIAKGQQEEVIRALSGVIQSGEADFGTYQTLGMIYEKKKSYKSAADMYQKALQMDPQNTDALVALGDCQAGLGQLSDAVISYEQAVMMNPKAVEEHKTLGDLYMRQKKTDQAMRAYRKYLDAGGKDSDIAEQIGRDMYEKKQYEEAVKYLSMVSGSAAANPYHLLAHGESCFQVGKYDDAIQLLGKLLARNPKVSTRKDVLMMIAVAYEKKGNKASTVKYLDDYLTLARDQDVAFKRAFMEEDLNRTSSAEKHYQENTRYFPSDYRNFLQLGLFYTKNKESLGNAITMLKKVASLVDTIPNVWLEIARAYGKLGRADDELAAYKKYVQSDPQNVEANVRLGMILLDQGKVSEGLIYLETANTLKPNNFDVMIALAKGYVRTNRSSEAEDLLVKAREAKPNDIEIRRELVSLYRRKGDNRKALDEIKELLKLGRDNETLLLYAKLLFEDGRQKEAEEAIEDIRATDPENIEALMLLGMSQRSRKKYDEAIETYKEIIYINGGYAPAIFERAEVYMLQNKPQWAQKFYERALRADPKHARSELGLAVIAKLNKDRAGYVMHLTKAYQLDPKDPVIVDEYKKSQK